MIKNVNSAFIASIVVLFSFSPCQSKTVGYCGFNSDTLRFAGSVEDTTKCLLRKVKPKGSGSDDQLIPDWLKTRAAKPFPYSQMQVVNYLQMKGIQLSDLSNRFEASDSRNVRYFVIHDTASPRYYYPTLEFPDNINKSSWPNNNLKNTSDSLGQKVNLIISRDGNSKVLKPWGAVRSSPAVKLEQNSLVAQARPLFVHVENVQPRIVTKDMERPNLPRDKWYAWKAPSTGLGPLQERRLAEAYFVASMHAGRWLIPAYHFNVDRGLAGGHDDPQNMNLESWVSQLEAVEAGIAGSAVSVTHRIVLTASDIKGDAAPSGSANPFCRIEAALTNLSSVTAPDFDIIFRHLGSPGLDPGELSGFGFTWSALAPGETKKEVAYVPGLKCSQIKVSEYTVAKVVDSVMVEVIASQNPKVEAGVINGKTPIIR